MKKTTISIKNADQEISSKLIASGKDPDYVDFYFLKDCNGPILIRDDLPIKK